MIVHPITYKEKQYESNMVGERDLTRSLQG